MKMIRKRTKLSRLTLPVTDAHPIIGGNAPRSATDDDVLRRRALQPHRVDDDVEEDGEGEESTGKPVDQKPERDNGTDRQCHAERKRLFTGDLAGRYRTLLRPRHDLVDVCVVPHVQSTGRAGTDSNAQDCDSAQDRVNGAGCEHQADKRREDHKRHDARLQERDVITHGSYAAIPGGGVLTHCIVALNERHAQALHISCRCRRMFRRYGQSVLTVFQRSTALTASAVPISNPEQILRTRRY